ncbi:MAG TPA: LuxR family transcriptional regulator, partial [Segeticoccus sp.]|nr:LuxR family transcriptional regulator [Segeticoccus sp.]
MAVRSALQHSRLLTLTGPGGAGKTRLALAAGAQARAPAGAAWVELAEVVDPHLVTETVRTVLAVPGASGSATQAIVEGVGDAELLLALDNCEHLTAATATLVDQLLEGCPQLRVLATSRGRLGVEGEQIWPVAPLAAPDREQVSVDAVRAAPAARLFELRAQAVDPAFEITDANAAAVGRLCRRLDGLPLAVELAAARMRMLSVEQVLTGLDDVFRLLSGGPRTGPARHQSLRATLDWDHDLLSEGERVLFRRLGVFPGSFDLAAAVAVAGPRELGGGPVGAELVDLLAGLVDQSLVTVRRVAGQVRYRLLAPVRSYAREHLVIAGEQATVAGAHLDHYAALVEHSQPLL